MKKYLLFVSVLYVFAAAGCIAVENPESEFATEPGPARVIQVASAPKAVEADTAAEKNEPAEEAPVVEKSAPAEEASQEPSEEKTIGTKSLALVAVGDVDTALMERVRSFAETQLAMEVVLLPALEAPASDALYGEAEGLASLLGDEHALLVGVVNPTYEATEHAVKVHDNPVAVVNHLAMTLEGGEGEKFERRIEKSVVRGFCMLLGAEVVPNPFSCLYRYATFGELDRMARGVDPPSLTRVQQEALKRDIILHLDNPLFLITKP